MMNRDQFLEYIESDDPTTGWTLVHGTEEEVHDRVNKLILKVKTEAYDEGFKAGANQQNNRPCVCGFWGDKK